MISLPIPAIKEIEKLAQSKPGCISFSQGAMRMGGVHPDIKEYVRQISLSDKADYYQDALGIIPLRKKIADMITHHTDGHVSYDHVAITQGSMGAISTLCMTLLRPGDEVILPEPTYPVYQHAVTLAKGKVIFAGAWHMIPRDKDSFTWRFDLKKIEELVTINTRMIIISNPSNPLGVFLSKAELMMLARLCESKGIYLVVDEIYDDFVFEGNFYSASFLATESDRIIRVGSFSKNFAMSGWRVGFVIASKKLIAALAGVQTALINCPNVIGQYGALFGLEHKDDVIKPYVAKLEQNKKTLCEFFTQLQQQGFVSFAPPQAGFYLFFKTQDHDSQYFVMDVLEKVNVALVPGKDFGPSAQHYVRLCFSREPNVVVEGIHRLQDYFMQKQRTSLLFSNP